MKRHAFFSSVAVAAMLLQMTVVPASAYFWDNELVIGETVSAETLGKTWSGYAVTDNRVVYRDAGYRPCFAFTADGEVPADYAEVPDFAELRTVIVDYKDFDHMEYWFDSQKPLF